MVRERVLSNWCPSTWRPTAKHERVRGVAASSESTAQGSSSAALQRRVFSVSRSWPGTPPPTVADSSPLLLALISLSGRIKAKTRRPTGLPKRLQRARRQPGRRHQTEAKLPPVKHREQSSCNRSPPFRQPAMAAALYKWRPAGAAARNDDAGPSGKGLAQPFRSEALMLSRRCRPGPRNALFTVEPWPRVRQRADASICIGAAPRIPWARSAWDRARSGGGTPWRQRRRASWEQPRAEAHDWWCSHPGRAAPLPPCPAAACRPHRKPSDRRHQKPMKVLSTRMGRTSFLAVSS